MFGPPSVLKALLDYSSTLKNSDINVLPAFGAVHASHLVTPDFVDIIGESHLLRKSMKSNYKLISGSRYSHMACYNLWDLLQEILLDIFQKRTDPVRLFQAAGSYLRKSDELSLLVLESTGYLLLLRRSLHAQGFKVALLTDGPCLPTTKIRGGSGSVAIVGMSGKFPGSENVDEMWNSIMQREEWHKKVMNGSSETRSGALTPRLCRFPPIDSMSTFTWIKLA